ncbi:Cu-oxidase-domain-containing protein [Pluteus cervinus]|uniref:Cu-oxidase-domain-containing protein n=1 Tax=Pluteus cervinus TaxID=181527 RepID=A0ACD3AR50_9AGAR|nr:Cu-oxidase-domain-containing protein [Pluteus cervinus]
MFLESTVITLADWYHTPALAGPSLPRPDTTLISGKGRWGSDPTADLAVINVAAGNRYRFRLVSISCDPQFDFSIDGHSLTIIEADGVSTEPYTVDKLTIFAGQRYSFILEANQNVGNYWIRALPNIQSIRGQRFENGVNSAILRYDTAPDAEPTTFELSNPTVLNEADLRPFVTTPAVGVHELGAADINLTLNMTFQNGAFSINNATFIPSNNMSVLLQILSGARTPQELLPAGSVIELERNRVVELTIPALAVGGPHPMHLHGHTFQVIRSAGSNQLNWDNPISRDVVSSGTSGSIVIRFTTDNPGPWILHWYVS